MSSFFSSWSSKSAATAPKPRIRVLMVCMGNICRSPTAEAVLRHKLAQAGLSDLVLVDSAGTHAYHVGSPPDDRAQHAAGQRGYDLSKLKARKVRAQDFQDFDLVLAMDFDNLSLLEAHCPATPNSRDKLRRLVEFVPAHSSHAGTQTVPDPYYGGPAGFEFVLDLVEAACDGLVRHLDAQLQQAVKAAASPTETGAA
jgi:protein-tyrosine phosphatase